MKLPTPLVILSAAAIIAISYVVQNPWTTLLIPKVGHHFWTLLGGEFPPFIDSIELMNYMKCVNPEKCPWLKSGDVIVDICAKCGTNWMLTIVHELRTWDKPELRDFEDILDISPWPEFRRYPADLTESRYLTWGDVWNRSEYQLREYKSHFPAYLPGKNGGKVQVMPVKERPDIKYIIMVRNPADTLSSFVKFMDVHRQEFLDSFGGTNMWSSDISKIVDELDTGFYEMSPFPFYLTWKEYKDEPNVLFLHYTDLVHDLRGNIEKVAKFLDIEVTKEGMDIVESRSNFKFMKIHANRYQYLGGKNREIPVLTSDGLVRKGGVKVSNRELTPEIQKRIHDFGLSKMSPEDVELLEHGFDSIKK